MAERVVWLECINCGKTYPSETVIYRCSSCGGLLDIILDYDAIKETISWAKFKERPLCVWRYFELLPVSHELKVSLFEGGTPLYPVKRLGKLIGLDHLYVKFEGANPTGSFKDRGMTVGVTKVVELGIKSVGCASTGNTSASLAAYAAKAGLTCFVLLPAGKVAMGKLSQAMLHGAQVIALKGNFDQALSIVEQICNEEKIYLLNSLNPWRLEGQKTTAYEIVDQLGFVPDRIVLPVGNCGNISAIWKGFKELERVSLTESLPKMTGIQAEGASPIVNMIKRNLKLIQFTDKPETIATAIRIGRPVNWPKAVKAIRESNGTAESVADSEIIAMQKALAKLEGIGVEPASAASLAGVKKLLETGVIDRDETIVCITTGHMLKDPQEAIEIAEPVSEFEPDIIKVKNFIESKLAEALKPAIS
ncbi:MAG: threonine synthase [Candidatus Odinarchaeum yellowstonii]|uniref:Threonine synthase n=1 Tax=Odinarchaeota yellowstonii (strain LCB_4) TaxID=1841599 RepID=A0AAF0D350_ODILC|nr:MAG: threonine synthase [Candidatus Odinarchaeum yellowstonii]